MWPVMNGNKFFIGLSTTRFCIARTKSTVVKSKIFIYNFWILKYYLSYSLSFSRTFWDSSRRSCRALSLLESSSAVLMSSHSCLLRSCRLRAEVERELARLTEPFPSRLSQSPWSPSGTLEWRTDSSTSKSCQRTRRGKWDITHWWRHYF